MREIVIVYLSGLVTGGTLTLVAYLPKL